MRAVCIEDAGRLVGRGGEEAACEMGEAWRVLGVGRRIGRRGRRDNVWDMESMDGVGVHLINCWEKWWVHVRCVKDSGWERGMDLYGSNV